MKSSARKVIKDAHVSGIVFCSPTGELSEEDSATQDEKENLKALEEFWKNKGIQEGYAKGIEEGKKTGEEQGYRKGYEEGKKIGGSEVKTSAYQQGEQDGYERNKKEFADALALVSQLAQKIAEEKTELLEKYKAELIEFALAAAEKVILVQLKNPEIMEQVIEKFIHQARHIVLEQKVTVNLAQQDFEMLQNKFQTIGRNASEVANLHFVGDPYIPRGHFRIESPKGLLNNDVRRSLDDLLQHVLTVPTQE